MTTNQIEYDPEIDDSDPAEIRRFDDLGYVRKADHMADGVVYMDDTRAFALISPDVTHVGESEKTMNVEIDPFDIGYGRTEYPEQPSGKVKVWVFLDGDRQIAIKFDYISLVRDIFGLSLDEIRDLAKGAGPVTGPGETFTPVLVDPPEAEYRALIMPHRALTD